MTKSKTLRTLVPLGILTAGLAFLTTSGLFAKASGRAPSSEKATDSPLNQATKPEVLRSSPLVASLLAEFEKKGKTPPSLETRRAALLLEDQLLAQAYAEKHREELLSQSSVSEEELHSAYERQRAELVDPNGEPLSFESVRERLHEGLAAEKQISAGRRLIGPLYQKLHVEHTEAGRANVHLGSVNAIPAAMPLALVGQRSISEGEFRAFVNETVPESSRYQAFAKPNARVWMLASFLDVVVLAEAGRSDGLDKTPEFRTLMQEALGSLIQR